MLTENERKIIQAEQLCEVFLLYFDEKLGHIPILVSPEDVIKKNEEKMHILRIHSIWFLDLSDKTSLDRVDLEYGDKMYFAKKFLVPSKRIKRRAGLEEENYDTIVLILALPIEMDIFGGALIKEMTERINKHFKFYLSELIRAEIEKLDMIKTQKSKELIERGDKIKKRISKLIKNICSQYFQSVIKKTDTTILKIQKAISYLSLKGVPISYIVSNDKKIGFSNIKLFDKPKVQDLYYKSENPFRINKINVINDRKEVEIIITNRTKDIFDKIIIKVSSLYEFFEQLILYDNIEKWLPGEEVLFILPDISQDHEYILYLIEEKRNKIIFQEKIKAL
ncbi:MAG: hypothetical protein ACFFBP_11450 [Promethearchaeota archaeon]